jgi:hypothetical protein
VAREAKQGLVKLDKDSCRMTDYVIYIQWLLVYYVLVAIYRPHPLMQFLTSPRALDAFYIDIAS